MNLIGVINTGSTSTKLAIFGYKNRNASVGEDLAEDLVELERKNIPIKGVSDVYKEFMKDFNLRKEEIGNFFNDFLRGRKADRFVCIAARGGLLKPLKGGVYRINNLMVEDLLSCKYGNHPSNMAAPIAYGIARKMKIEAFTAYPVITDEMDEITKYTGIPEIKRKSVFHALNHKSVARYISKKLGRRYEDLNLIVCHMGGGITVGIHVNGNVVDVNNGLDGDGPFSIDRAGTVPAGDLINMCFNGNHTFEDMRQKIVGNAGIYAYLGTKDAKLIEKIIDEDIEIAGISPETAKMLVDACAYRVAKEICSLAAYTSGNIDAVVVTGGLAYFKYLTEEIKRRVSFLARFIEYPGENELGALAEYSFLALIGQEKILNYGS